MWSKAFLVGLSRDNGRQEAIIKSFSWRLPCIHLLAVTTPMSSRQLYVGHLRVRRFFSPVFHTYAQLSPIHVEVGIDSLSNFSKGKVTHG